MVPVVIIIVLIIVCCCCYYSKKKKNANRSSALRTHTIQPTTTNVISTGISAAPLHNSRPAYPMQNLATTSQQQPIVQGNLYASPQRQQPTIGYSTLQHHQPPVYSPEQEQSVYLPPEPKMSELHTAAPPAYSDLSAYPPYQPSGYPQ